MTMKKQNHTYIKKILTFVTTISLSFMISLAQIAESPDSIKVQPLGCEFNTMALDLANHEAGTDSVMVILAFPGKADKKSTAIERRLHTARAYLTEVTGYRNHDSLVVGRVMTADTFYYGGIDIYVKGKLQARLTSFQDEDFFVANCSGDESTDKRSRERRHLLFPWRYPKP